MAVASSERLILEFVAKDSVTGPLKVIADNAIAQVERLDAAVSQAFRGSRPAPSAATSAPPPRTAPGLSASGGDATAEREERISARLAKAHADAAALSKRLTDQTVADILAALDKAGVRSKRAGVAAGTEFSAGMAGALAKSESNINQVAASAEKAVTIAERAAQRAVVASARGREQSRVREASAEVRALDDAARLASGGLSRVGGEIAGAFGPAGPLVRDVAGEVLALGGGFDVLVGKLGISRGALLALGVGGAVLASLGVALGSVVGEAAEAEKRMLGLAAFSANPKGAIESAQKIGDAIREKFGGALSDDSVQILSQAALIKAGGDAGLAYGQALRAAAVAALSNGDPTAALKTLDSLFQNFGVEDSEAPAALNEIFVNARAAKVSFQAFAEVLENAAPTANRLGFSLGELASIAAAMELSGGNLSETSRGLEAILKLVGDASGAARKRLEGLGLGFVDANGKLRPLQDSLAALGALTKQQPALLFELFDNDKLRRSVSAAAENVDKARAIRLRALTDSDALDTALSGVLDLPSLNLGRMQEQFSTGIKEAGRAALDALFAAPQKIRTEIQLPENAAALREQIQESLAAGDVEGAKSAARELNALRERAVELRQQEIEKAREAYAQDVRSRPLFGDKNERAIDRGVQDRQIRDFVPQGPDDAAFAKLLDGTDLLNRGLRITGGLIDDIGGKAERVIGFTLSPTGNLEKVVADTVAAIPKQLLPIDLVLRDDGIQASIRKVLDRTDLAALPIKVRVLPPDVENARKFLDSLPDTYNVRANLKPEEQAAYDKATAALERFRTELEAIAALDADIAARSQTGPDRIAADAEKRARDVRKRLAESPVFTRLDPDVSARIFSGADAIEDKGQQDAAAARTRETAEASARLLGLKIQLIDRERGLAAAVGVTAGSEADAARALSERAKAARELAIASLDARRAQIDPTNTDALAALDKERDLLLKIADAESAAAAAAFDRARIDRGARTTDLVTGAGDELRVGLDREFAAIERNRAAKIKAAEDGVRAGTLDADALARLLPLYDRIAARDRERAARAASQRDAEDIAGLIRETSGLYADQAAALDLLRAVERDRYAETLRDEGLTQDAIRERLALFDQLTAKQKQTLAIQFSRAPAVQLALDGLDEEAFARAQAATDRIVQGLIAAEAPAEQIGRALEEGMQRGLDAIADARTGMTALVDGWKAGWKDFLREVNDDASFGGRAAGQLGGGFRDSLSGAFQGKSNDGESIGQTFLRSNLENVQKQAADFAANKVSAAIFGPLFGEKDKPSTPDERLLAASTTFDAAVARFAAAVDASPGANFALSPPPDSIRAPGFGAVDFPANDFVSLPPGVDPGLGAPAGEDLAAAGEEFSSTVGAGAQSAAAAFVQGGDAFGAGITGVVGALGNQLGGFLTSLLGGAGGGLLGFAEGGIVQGSLTPYTPHRAQYGRVVRQKTLIQVAENPGLEEAIIPLRGGAVPVTLSRREDPNRRRDADRDATTELVQAMRGRAVAAEREARQQRPEKAGTTVSVAGSTVSLSVTVQGGGSGNAGAELLGAMPEIEKRLTAAIELGTNRRLINAIRGA